MYEPDELDRVVAVAGLPQCDTGAPSPVVAATEGELQVAYICRTGDEREVAIAVVTFADTRAHTFGMPNDEALRGHPLFERGVGFYGAFQARTPHGSAHLKGSTRFTPCTSRDSMIA